MFHNTEKAKLIAYINTAKTIEKGFIINCYGIKGSGKTYTITTELEKESNNNKIIYTDVLEHDTPFRILINIHNKLFNKTLKFNGSNISMIGTKIIEADKKESTFIFILDNMEAFNKSKLNVLYNVLERFTNSNIIIILIWNTNKQPSGYNIYFNEYTKEEKETILKNLFESNNITIDPNKSIRDNIINIIFEEELKELI